VNDVEEAPGPDPSAGDYLGEVLEPASSHGLEPLADDYAEPADLGALDRPYCAEHDMYRPCHWCPAEVDSMAGAVALVQERLGGEVLAEIRPLPHGPNARLVADNATRAPEFLSHWEAQARNAEAELPGKDIHLHPGAALEAFERRVLGIWDRGGPKIRYNLERAVTTCERRMDNARATLVEARRHVPKPARAVGPEIDFPGASA